jgi:hypothetical protein
VRFYGKLYRRKLETGDLARAKRKLRKFKDDLERTDATKRNTSFANVLDDYAEMLNREARKAGWRRIVVRHRLALFPLLCSLQEAMYGRPLVD